MTVVAVVATVVASGMSGVVPTAAQTEAEGGPTVTVEPSRGLRDGDMVDIEISGGTPGTLFGIYLCDSSLQVPLEDVARLSDFCITPEPSPLIHRIDGDPTVVPVPVHEVLPRSVEGQFSVTWCGSRRGACRFVVWMLSGGTHASQPIDVQPTLTASPSTELVDGQAVTVTGRHLSPTYEGPMVWFARTGIWSLVQCRSDALVYPSVAGIFRRCAVAPPGVVTIPGSHLSVDTEVRARFTSILGDPVDCTTSPDACVLALVRMEHDQSLTIHPTPIAFAG
jgi:hypothetical protein